MKSIKNSPATKILSDPGLMSRYPARDVISNEQNCNSLKLKSYCSPFSSLEDADIVYFKTGPSKVWKLTNSDWRAVYKKYFEGRKAYIYEGGKLNTLN